MPDQLDIRETLVALLLGGSFLLDKGEVHRGKSLLFLLLNVVTQRHDSWSCCSHLAIMRIILQPKGVRAER